MKDLKKGDLLTIIGISDFMANTSFNVVKATGDYTDGKPILTENKKGARKKFTLRNLDKKDTLVFKGEVPFKRDFDVPKTGTSPSGFTSTIMRGNACINLVGDAAIIKDYVLHKNLNSNFTAYDTVLLIDVDKDAETPLFPDTPTSHAVVMRVRADLSTK